MTASLDDYDFELPVELIAQRPALKRRDSRLLHVPVRQQPLEHHGFAEIVNLIDPGDLLVFNDTRVIPARLHGRKASGGQIEVLLERLLDDHSALVQIRASRAPRTGQALLVPGAELQVTGRQADFFEVQVVHGPPIEVLFEQRGEIPLPPYIERDADDDDRVRYQTVYACETGAVAAPTAGLHFDQTIFDDLHDRGVKTGFLTLHVGAGTFQPVRSDTVEGHVIHKERYSVSDQLVRLIEATKQRQGKVVAVGTTVVRALESAGASGELAPVDGETEMFIKPGHRFSVVDRIVTNFHLPRSSLLIMMAAFTGRERLLDVYQQAVAAGYRFYSYGDAMLVEREHQQS